MAVLRRRLLYSFLALIALFFAPALSLAQPPAGYYDAAQGLSGQAMKQALHDIIDDHAWLQYGGLWTAFQTTDVRPDGFLWDIYSDIPGGTPPYLYTLGTDQCGTYNGEGDCYNREHSFPSSWFNDAYPMYTDLFHLYPTDGWVNQKRGSLPYGVVGAIDWSGQNGTKVGAANVQGNTVVLPAGYNVTDSPTGGITFAQAGGTDTGALDQALESVGPWVAKRLG